MEWWSGGVTARRRCTLITPGLRHSSTPLPIGRTGDDEAVQFLKRLAVVEKPVGEPVQEFRMRGRRTHVAEVVWRIDDSPAKVILPDAIHDGTAGQHVPRIRNPFGQCGAPAA